MATRRTRTASRRNRVRPADRRSATEFTTRDGRGWLAAVLCIVLSLAGVAAPPAIADEPSPTPTVAAPAGPAVGECLTAGEVWLVIRTDDGQLLRSECVGTPTTGADALRAAEVPTVMTKGYYCTLAGYPSRCPRTYRDQFWQYWHAAGVDAAWVFSQKGAGSHAPQPGSIEGWCYNPQDVARCHPPKLAATDRPAPRLDLPPAVGPDLDLTVWIALGLLAAAGAVYLVVRRRGS